MLKRGAAQAHLSLHLSKCHIVGNHVSRLIFDILHSPNGLLSRRQTFANIIFLQFGGKGLIFNMIHYMEYQFSFCLYIK